MTATVVFSVMCGELEEVDCELIFVVVAAVVDERADGGAALLFLPAPTAQALAATAPIAVPPEEKPETETAKEHSAKITTFSEATKPMRAAIPDDAVLDRRRP
jgi:hypothetical protein